MNKHKITNRQVFALSAILAIGSTIVIASSSMTAIAKQDAWISALLTPILGLGILWLFVFLSKHYPQLTYVEIIIKVLGKKIGTVVAAGFVFLCITITSHMIWHVGDFVTSTSMRETPPYAINLIFVIAVAISVLYGVETIARASEIFLGIISVIFIITMISLLPIVNYHNLLPMLDNGISPILRASIFSSTFSTFTMVLLFMIFGTNVIDVKKASKPLYWGYLWGEIMIFIATIMSLLVLGNKISSTVAFPVYLLARLINVGTNFNRMSFFLAAIWILTLLMKTVLYFYASVLGLSQLLGLKDYKRIVLPFAFVALLYSGVVYPDYIYQLYWHKFGWMPFITTFSPILAGVLCIVMIIKNRK